MKKLFSLALCSAMVLSLGACAPQPEETSTTSPTDTNSEASTENTSGSYPSKSISYIIPYSAGGGTDSLMRLVNSAVEKELGESIIVNNVSGGGGQVGITQLFGAAGDGYTIGAVTDTDQYITILTGENVAYDMDSFKYIASVNTSCDVIMASGSSGFTTLDELVEYAKANPGEITIGVSGQVHVLDAAMLSQEAGIEVTTIMHNGASDSFSACLGGQVDALVIDKKFVDQAEGQDITVLGSFGAERLDVISEVPTLTELGYDVQTSSRRLILAPGETPDEVVETLSNAIETATNTPEFIESMEKMSEVYKFVGSDELETQAKADFAVIDELLTANPDMLK